MNGGLVSVLIPVYRVEDYLCRCLDSVCCQSYRNLEIILVDDGSPDGSGAICDAYAAKDSRVKVIHKENGGVAEARNTAVEAATGEYLVFVDSDDWVAGNYVERQLELLQQQNADMVACQELWTGDSQAALPQKKPEIKVLDTVEALENLLYQVDFDAGPHGKLYRTEIVKKYPYPKGKHFEDLGNTYRIVADCKKVVCTGEYLYYYFIKTGESITRSSFSQNRLHILEMMDRQYEDIVQWYPQLTKAVSSRKFSVYCYILRQLPEEAQWNELRERLWAFVKGYRLTMILDGKARRKNRLAALCAFGGLGLLRRV